MIYPSVSDPHVCSNAVAFVILCDASAHRVALEPCIGSYRPKTCYLDWFIRLVCFHVLFWSIEDLLGFGNEVPFFLVARFSQYPLTISTFI